METKGFLQVIWLVAFLAFATVSCWATAESLSLLLSTWPKVLCWVVTIGFFIIASVGTKMIVDSLNQNIYIERRGIRLIGGIIILVIFWLFCSMPTNTHTFIYRSLITDKVTGDISATQGYLSQIAGNTVNMRKAQREEETLCRQVDMLLGELGEEIQNELNPGFGPKAKEIFNRFASLLGVAKIEPLNARAVSSQERQTLINSYRTKFYELRDKRILDIRLRAEQAGPTIDNRREAAKATETLNQLQVAIAQGKVDLNDANGIKSVCDNLSAAYMSVKKNKEFVEFGSDADKIVYTAVNPVTKVKRMISVFDVWNDFLKGEFSGHGFVFWILISILVDVAAFIFFDLAFMKTDY